MSKTLREDSQFLNADHLDKWFIAKMKKYRNSQTECELQAVYNMLRGENTVRDDSFKSFVAKKS